MAETTEPNPELETVAEAPREAGLVDTTPLEALNLLSDLKGKLE